MFAFIRKQNKANIWHTLSTKPRREDTILAMLTTAKMSTKEQPEIYKYVGEGMESFTRALLQTISTIFVNKHRQILCCLLMSHLLLNTIAPSFSW